LPGEASEVPASSVVLADAEAAGAGAGAGGDGGTSTEVAAGVFSVFVSSAPSPDEHAGNPSVVRSASERAKRR
jgi:hypothetical protein